MTRSETWTLTYQQVLQERSWIRREEWMRQTQGRLFWWPRNVVMNHLTRESYTGNFLDRVASLTDDELLSWEALGVRCLRGLRVVAPYRGERPNTPRVRVAPPSPAHPWWITD
jgi:hypothetical protein